MHAVLHHILSCCRQLAYRGGAGPSQYKAPVVLGKQEQWQLLEGHVVASAACVD